MNRWEASHVSGPTSSTIVQCTEPYLEGLQKQYTYCFVLKHSHGLWFFFLGPIKLGQTDHLYSGQGVKLNHFSERPPKAGIFGVVAVEAVSVVAYKRSIQIQKKHWSGELTGRTVGVDGVMEDGG
jgi:hypothetical protein